MFFINNPSGSRLFNSSPGYNVVITAFPIIFLPSLPLKSIVFIPHDIMKNKRPSFLLANIKHDMALAPQEAQIGNSLFQNDFFFLCGIKSLQINVGSHFFNLICGVSRQPDAKRSKKSLVMAEQSRLP